MFNTYYLLWYLLWVRSFYSLSDWGSSLHFLVFWEFSFFKIMNGHYILSSLLAPASIGKIIWVFFFILLIWFISLIFFKHDPAIHVLVMMYYYNLLIMLCHLLYALLDSVCWSFIKDFCVFIHENSQSVFFCFCFCFPDNIFTRFWYQSYIGSSSEWEMSFPPLYWGRVCVR